MVRYIVLHMASNILLFLIIFTVCNYFVP